MSYIATNFNIDFPQGANMANNRKLTYYSHHPKTASRQIGDEMIILDQQKNIMITLNDSGGIIWSLLAVYFFTPCQLLL